MGRKRKISNQNSTSAAKVVRQDGKKQNQKARNPLFMTQILPQVLNYLNLVSLKNSRLVCKLWRFEGGKILVKESSIKLRYFATKDDRRFHIQEENKHLGNFLALAGTSATFQASCNNIKDPKRLKSIFPLLLQRTSALSLNHFYRNVQGKQAVQFLEFFPNLKILHLINDGNWDEGFSAETYRLLLEKFESLEEIRLTLWSSDNFTNLLLTKSELAINEIQLDSDSPFFEKYLESGCNWPIDALVLKKSQLNPQRFNSIQAFLDKISPSLDHLRWSFVGPLRFPIQYLVPWANNLMNPSTLTELETLEISCFQSNSLPGDFSCLLYFFALQLPNLKKLTVDQVPGNLEKRIREWNSHPNAQGRTLRSESLEELEFILHEKSYEIPVESFFVFSRRLWPNLKSLWIENPPMDLPNSFLLPEWIGLERLDLKFAKMKKSDAELWTKWFAGEKESKDDNFTLKDLKDLKHFGLMEDWRSQLARIATDILAESSLKFMTQLQCLHFTDPKMSGKAKKMLRETLGPNVSISFHS